MGREAETGSGVRMRTPMGQEWQGPEQGHSRAQVQGSESKPELQQEETRRELDAGSGLI